MNATSVSLQDYSISTDLVYSGYYTTILRGIRNTDQKDIVIKILKATHPTPDDIARFKHEYEIAQLFSKDIDIVHVYALEKFENSYAIVMENIPMPTLAEVIAKEKKLFLQDFLALAIALTKALGHIHAQQIIHKDINPNNIMCDFSQKKVRLIDFGLSASLPKEHAEIVNPNVLEGTLPYLSPEQTGRMNRGIDYRTDYYSLGVVFYELLAGRLPFISNDAMELVHCHIAVSPQTPHEVDPTIPPIISDIIMKLLAKNAEDRYQNVNGLLADLEECQTQLHKTGKIQSFPIASNDIFSRFQIPEKLYGREAEIKQMMQTYEHIMQGGVELMLVTGYSGIGKSSLVHEIHKPVVAKKGYFISGKFDQFKHNIPYSAITAAFDKLVKQLLTEPKDRIDYFKQIILDSVGKQGKIITDVIPALTAIIGNQPDVLVLNPTESLNRFSYVFQNFIRALCGKTHPLVLFLDDLQWADSASLKMIETLLTSLNIGYLFIIGAYRSNEVSAAHPVMTMIENVQKQQITIQSITLTPLVEDNVAALLSDTLHQKKEQVEPLARLICKKTGGNPFFLIQLLLSLYQEGLIQFNLRRNEWTWDLQKIEEKKMTDNVIDLMVNKLKNLKPDSQLALQYAACIGNQFEISLLSNILQKKSEQVLIDLQEALWEGYIISLGESYRALTYQFAHDRVQQAAYSLMDEAMKKKIHLQLARLLLKQSPESLFDIVNHYNQGLALAVEKKQIAELNLKASLAAKEGAAFKPALQYIEYALACVDQGLWVKDYPFMFALYNQATKCAYLCGNYDLMEQYAQIALKHTTNNLDALKITQTQIFSSASRNKPKQAVDLAIKIMNQVGIPLPRKPKLYHVLYYVMKTRWLLRNKSFEQLLNLPEMKDETKTAIISLIISVCSSTYESEQHLLPILICIIIQLSVRYGNAKGSSYGYGYWGLILCRLEDVEKGYQFGQFALSMVDKYRDEEHRAKINLANHEFIKHWKDSIHSYLQQCLENFDIGLERGDIQYGSFSIMAYAANSIQVGVPLSTLLSNCDKYKPLIKKYGQMNPNNYIDINLQCAANLCKFNEEPALLIGKYINENKMLPLLIQANNQTGLSGLFLRKAFLLYIFNEYNEALRQIKNAGKYIHATIAVFNYTTYHFYRSLTLLALYSQCSAFKKIRYFMTIKSILKKFSKWSNIAPANHLQRYLLIQAEYQYHIKKNLHKAASLYDQAIEVARQNQFLNEEAIANELAAQFYLAQGREKIARIYLEDARHAYLLWGANAKVNQLENNYPKLLRKSSPTRGTISAMVLTESSGSVSSDTLDIETIQKSSIAISSTIVLADLLQKLMHIVIENAGAQKSLLLLNKEDVFTIEAEGNINQEVNVLQSIKPTADQLPLSLIHYCIRAKESVVLKNATRSDRFMNDPYITTHHPLSILALPLINQGRLTGILYLENNLTEGAFTEDRIHVLNLLSSQIAISIDNARLYENTKMLNVSFERFLPADFLSLLQKKSILDIRLGDHVQEKMTILFMDIRDFTARSEKMTPAQNFHFINEFLNIMSPIIRKHHGFIDKYIGDAIMALFPKASDDALQCAIEMQTALKTYNQSQAIPVKIGIGINTGLLMMGTVGEKDRMNATVISDAVNLAARLEKLTKDYNASILISEETYASLSNPMLYQIEKVGKVCVKGKEIEIMVYRVNTAADFK